VVLSAGSLSLRGVRGGSEVEKQLLALGSSLLAIRVLGAENSDGCGPPFWGGMWRVICGIAVLFLRRFELALLIF
jgi:hypothetical protein